MANEKERVTIRVPVDRAPESEPEPEPETDPQGIWDDIISKLADFFGNPQIEGGRPWCRLPWHSEPSQLDENGDYNVIPDGVPSDCKSKLVVVVDGNHPINDILDRTLDHVSTICKGTTKHVLINVVICVKALEQQWDTQWAVYEPKFTALAASGNGVPTVTVIKYMVWLKVATDKLKDPRTPIGQRVILLNDPEINDAYVTGIWHD